MAVERFDELQNSLSDNDLYGGYCEKLFLRFHPDVKRLSKFDL